MWDDIFKLQTPQVKDETRFVFGREAFDQMNQEMQQKAAFRKNDDSEPKDHKLFIALQVPKENLIGSIIQWKTDSIYSHAGISDNVKFEPFYDMISYFRIGNDRREFLGTTTRQADAMDIYSFPVTKNQIDRFHNIMEFYTKKSSAGKMSYDFLALVAALFKSDKARKDLDEHKEIMSADSIRERNKFICSAFVASVLSMVSPKVKWFIMKNDFRINTFNPGQLLLLPDMKPEYRIEAHSGKIRKIPREVFENIGKISRMKASGAM
jgi:hypothetical protein